jgi:RHS repeat-associated protein
MNFKEFSGGLAYNESIDFQRYSWVDLDGDGILDRLRKEFDGSDVMVAFGSNSGLLDEVRYGPMADGAFDLIGDIPTGEQASLGRSRGLGGGADFTVAIGPLCLAGCYIIVNPGRHAERSVSSNQVQVVDVNGDGYPDSVRSDEDDEISVRLNRRGRTNLLRAVKNPLGGELRLDYERDGNTVEQPYSQWVLSSVEVDDNRPGDGADTQLTTYDYADNRFNPLEREFLGYGTVTERERGYAGDGDARDDPLLRSVERRYRNATVFDQGLVTSERTLAPDGTPLRETRSDWSLVDLATGREAEVAPTADDPAGVRLLGTAVGPVRTRVEQRWYDDTGALGERTWSTYDYDELGNVVRQVDVGEPELAGDDLIMSIVYTDCERSSDPSNYHTQPPQCPADPPAGGASPLWSPLRCPTWTSLPATIEVKDADGNVLRHRDGSPSLCDNSSITDLKEYFSETGFAETLLSYDDWGSYNRIEYPENADGERLRVDYVYDDVNHGNVAQTDDSHGKVVEYDCPDVTQPCDDDDAGAPAELGITGRATFDGRTGRVASRTDANGQRWSYTYDAFGRLASVTSPYEQGSGRATVTFEYFPTAPGYAYAVAHHFDAFHPAEAIDTVAFVDGTGRQTQTKHDSTVFRGADTPAEDVMVVSGAVTFDALGRPAQERYPTEEPLGTIGIFNTGTSATAPRVTRWDLLDRVTEIVNPDGAITRTGYGFDGDADLGATVFTTTVTDAEGKQQRSYSDVRDNVLMIDDVPGPDRIRTRYAYDPLGQLTRVTDNGGNVTRHAYDLLGRRTSTDTPDGGLVEMRWDGASNLIAEVTPNLRARGEQITYSYEFERLVGIDYPDGTRDVTYTYGEAGAPGNGAARIVTVEDGARVQHLTYDPLGAVASESSTMLVHNLNDETGQRLTFDTAFTYDAFGRLRTLQYPDGELLTHDYDSGGLLARVSGEKEGRHYAYLDRLEYDEFLDRRFQLTGNGVRTQYRYDAATRRLVRQTTDTPAREIQDLNYTYDRVGNVLRMANEVPGPVPSLMGGPSVQNYAYDRYYRLRSADGELRFGNGKRRNYSYSTTYDADGNVARKTQTDLIEGKSQAPTTYDLPIGYRAAKPHQIEQIGRRSYTYDLNGNFTGWTDDTSGQSRTVTWDAADRMRSAADQGSTTRYAYDDTGRLAIERGPQGETAFVNRYYTVRNGSVPWKHIWAGDDRLATKRAFDDGSEEHMRYFLHKDLQGSTNMVTDHRALAFQHLEYFPSGETWAHEQSTEHRTPYRYAGGYLDEVRNLINLGERWYEPREQVMYSPEPVLVDDPLEAIDDPALLPAYTYAESNPLSLVDLDGRAPSSVRTAFRTGFALLSGGQQAKALFARRAAASVAAAARARAQRGAVAPTTGATRGSRLWQAISRFGNSPAAERLQGFADRFDAKPIAQFTLVGTRKAFALQEVALSPTFAKQFTVFKRGAATPATPSGPGATATGTAASGAAPPSTPAVRPATALHAAAATSAPPPSSDTP